MKRDPHAGPVEAAAWELDRETRTKGRVQIFNATRPGGLDGWTMDAAQYDVLVDHILTTIDDCADDSGAVTLKLLVETAQDRLGTHPLFPKGRLRNYVTCTKVDLEARCVVERLAGSPQRVVRWRESEER